MTLVRRWHRGREITLPAGLVPKQAPADTTDSQQQVDDTTTEQGAAFGVVDGEKGVPADIVEDTNDVPDGNPTSAWTVKQLDAYGKMHDLDYGEQGANKADKLAVAQDHAMAQALAVDADNGADDDYPDYED